MAIDQGPLSQYSSAFDFTKTQFSFPTENPPSQTQGLMADQWVHGISAPYCSPENFGAPSQTGRVPSLSVAQPRIQDQADNLMLNNSYPNQYPSSNHQNPSCSTTSFNLPHDLNRPSPANAQNGTFRGPPLPLKANGAPLSTTFLGCRSEVSHDHQRGETPHYNQRKRRNVEKSKRPASYGTRNHPSSSPSTSESSERKQNSLDRRTPDGHTVTVCQIWLLKYPNTMPSEHQVSCLSFLFNDSFDAVRLWFQRSVSSFQKSEEPAFRSATSSDIDFVSTYRRNRGECNRKAKKSRRGIPNVSGFEWIKARPYACTSGCGRLFQKKERWKRHEEINRPTRLWLCRFQECENKIERSACGLGRIISRSISETITRESISGTQTSMPVVTLSIQISISPVSFATATSN